MIIKRHSPMDWLMVKVAPHSQFSGQYNRISKPQAKLDMLLLGDLL